MSRVARIRLLAIVLAVLGVELACRLGLISPFTLIPPSEMIIGLFEILASGRMTHDILITLSNVATAFVLAVLFGFASGAMLFLLPRLRRVVDPLLATYYAIPIFVFYPFFIVLFGLNRMPQITIGFLLAVVAMIVNTLNGFDRVPRVLWKTARVHRMTRMGAVVHIVLPYATLYVLTGLKLAMAYSFIGVIAAEFILSGNGLGHEIAFAYNNFDNRTMYPLILFIILVATSFNMLLYAWERRFAQRQVAR